MEITRDVILDLLPLYLAGEVSEDTRALVEQYLESDPQLTKLAEQSATAKLPNKIPLPFTKENEMATYEKAKQQLILRTFVIVLAIVAPVMCILSMTLILGVTTFLAR